MFGGSAKAVHQIRKVADFPKVINSAFELAISGRPGPVVIEIPEDILFSKTDYAAPNVEPELETSLTQLDVTEVGRLLENAQRPLVVVGGSCWSQQGLSDVREFVHRYRCPVAASFRRQDLLDNEDPHYIGMLGLAANPALIQRVHDADVVIAIGSRLSEVTSNGYTLFQKDSSSQTLIHLYPQPHVLADIYKPTLSIHAPLGDLAKALATLPEPKSIAWTDWTNEARQDFVTFSQPLNVHPDHSGVDMGKVVKYVSDYLPDDAIICNGAGNFSVWVHRFYTYRTHISELAPTNGSMGYGLPAAIAAKIRHPEKIVVCFSGDGCFMMYPQELATAIQEDTAVILLIVNNGMYGTIRMHQEREYPGRVFASDLVNPDFVALAKSFGAYAERLTTFDDFPLAIERARKSNRVSVIELVTDSRQLSPSKRLEN
jgi:acetolactate synthase-1/2/3 large subunit